MFDLERCFWHEADLEGFSPIATALYFYLLHRANAQRWQMPIVCSTESLRFHVNATKQSILNAREELKRRGVIDFTPGTGKDKYPLYVLIPLRFDLTGSLTGVLTGSLTGDLTLYKNKDKEKDVDGNDGNARESDLSLEGTKNKLLADEKWHQDVISLISSQGIKNITIAGIKDLLNEFFLYLKTSGVNKGEEKDCRRHFVNWASKKLSKSLNKKISSYEYSKRIPNESASSERGASSKSSYFDAF